MLGARQINYERICSGWDVLRDSLIIVQHTGAICDSHKAVIQHIPLCIGDIQDGASGIRDARRVGVNRVCSEATIVPNGPSRTWQDNDLFLGPTIRANADRQRRTAHGGNRGRW